MASEPRPLMPTYHPLITGTGADVLVWDLTILASITNMGTM